MDKRTVVIMVVGAIAVSAVTAINANTQTVNTPLHALRMEQSSSRMDFLPTAVRGFVYATEKAYTLNYDVTGFCSNARLLATTPYESCDEITCETCQKTCYDYPSCRVTCNGCAGTYGVTCEGGYTCWVTCEGETCGYTCPSTCISTCSNC